VDPAVGRVSVTINVHRDLPKLKIKPCNLKIERLPRWSAQLTGDGSASVEGVQLSAAWWTGNCHLFAAWRRALISGVSCEDGMQTISEVTSAASSSARTLLYSKQIPIGSSDSYPGNITAFDPSTWTMEDDYFKDRMFAAAAIGIVIALMSFFMCIM